MNYEQALNELITSIRGMCVDVANIPFTQRNVGNQKLQVPHWQVHIDVYEPTGISDNFEYGKSAKQYEVFVDLACHRNHLTTYAGGTSSRLQEVLHAFEGHSGVYYKHFNTRTISFLRSTRIQRRDYPVEKNQWEERSVTRLVFSMLVVDEDPTDVGHIETITVNALKVYDTPTQVAVEETITVTYPEEINP
jgi:hypothetical protein